MWPPDHYLFLPLCQSAVAARGANEELSIKTLNDVLSDVAEWERLGQHLGVKQARLQEIGMMRGDPQLCKTDMLSDWMRSDLKASWEKLAIALGKMDHDTVAIVIRKTYCGSGT